MKKVIAIGFLSLVMVLSMAACGSTSGSVSSVDGSISASENRQQARIRERKSPPALCPLDNGLTISMS